MSLFVIFPSDSRAETQTSPKARATPPPSKSTQTTKSSPRPAAAKSALPKAFSEGIALSRQAEWEKALSRFTETKQRSLFKLKKSQRALLFLYLGLSYIHLLQQQRGVNAFEKALLLDPCIALPSRLDLSPQIRSLFAKTSKPYGPACERQKASALRSKVRRRPPPDRRPPDSRGGLVGPKPPEPSTSIRISAWIAIGLGAGAFGTGCVLGGLALWDELQRNEADFSPEGTVRYLELDGRAKERASAANIMFGVSGVLLFTGFALHISQWIQPLLPPPKARKAPQAHVFLRTF
ncbi:MAG: hypothetical protein EP343_21110 [Deltaproteobacteria bacterium]|nr:MAG: hypothetical protein EP343_21110 [Deltaproteobacteria bacterium]